MVADDAPVEPPTNHVIEFTVRGDWAHFRRIDTTTVKQSYRIIPPTTAMGLIAAMLGYDRDSYYETFATSNAAFAFVIESPVNPFQLAKLDLNTTDDDFESGRGKGALRNLIARETTLEDRQQRLYEYLKDPAYRIFMAVDDADIRTEFAKRLEEKNFVYTPCLGRSECLAHIEAWDEHQLSETTTETVDSTVPLGTAEATGDVSVERTARRLTKAEHSRRPTSFVSYAFSKTGDSVPVMAGTDAYTTGDHTLLFV